PSTETSSSARKAGARRCSRSHQAVLRACPIGPSVKSRLSQHIQPLEGLENGFDVQTAIPSFSYGALETAACIRRIEEVVRLDALYVVDHELVRARSRGSSDHYRP